MESNYQKEEVEGSDKIAESTGKSIIDEKLCQCQLCLDKIDPNSNLMCTLGGKTWCKKCIEYCLRVKQECPNCKRAITGANLVKNITLSDVLYEIYRKETASSLLQCSEHNKKLSIYCEICSIHECEDCHATKHLESK